MIRLIACDIDGTLIKKENGNIDERLFDLIKKFHKKGILFVPSTGRQFYNLTQIFAPVKDIITYVPENGAVIIHNGEEFFKAVLNINMVKNIAKNILDTPDVEIFLGSVHTSYILPKTKEFLDHVQNSIANKVDIVSSLDELPDDIVQISMCFKDKVDNNLIKHFLKDIDNPNDKLRHSKSGINWYDITKKGVHKGSSIQMLQKHLGISPEETIAFGDNYNDIEMLKNAGISYAMENAHDDIKNVAKYICNDVFSVLSKLYDDMEGK